MPSILISGASVAGPALAFWLARYGWDTTVVERAPALRPEGQNIDIRGAGREVVRRMGLEDAIRAATTGERGTQFLGDNGVVAEFPASTDDSTGPTAEVEILRGELTRILAEHTTDTDYLFGDSITGLDDTGDGVRVGFEHAADRTFDVVVLAEGLRSRTRRKVFGDEPRIKPLGMYMAYLTVPKTDTDIPWWRWYNAPGGRSITLRPDNVGTARATLQFISEPTGLEEQDLETQKQAFRETFADVGWEAPRLLAALDGAEVYMEFVSQVHAPRWSTGRIGMVGDAAYGPSPVSGMGTTLALVGAYVLAGELAAHAEPADAFAAYEKTMRPYVDQAQKLPPGTPKLANPQTRAGIAVFHTVLRAAASPVAKALGRAGGRIFSPPADAIDLPTYVAVPGR